MYSDFLVERGAEPDSEDDADFEDIQMLYNDTIGSAMAHRAELQRAMEPWKAQKPPEPPARIDPERRRSGR